MSIFSNNLDLHTIREIQEEKRSRHQFLMGETFEIGFMMASKSLVQLLANPVVGPLTNKYNKKTGSRAIPEVSFHIFVK